MEFKAAQIAQMLGGQVEGNHEVVVNDLSKIEEGKPGTLTFLANPKYTPYIYSTEASIAIVGADFEPEEELPPSLTLIRVDDAYGAFAKLLAAYEQMNQEPPGVSDDAFVHPSAEIGDEVFVGAGAYIGQGAKVGRGAVIHPTAHIGKDVSFGDGSIAFPGVKVLDRCEIGKACTLHAGVIIGADGFGFAPNSENNYKKVPQIGIVIVEDHVEIGANSCIDRATLGATIIRKGVKLDNLIQVAHNVEIGDNTVIAAQTGIAGSTKIGKNCMIGGQVGIVGHLTIADEVKIAAQSGVGSSIKEVGAIVQGSPAFGYREYKKSYVGFRRLPDLMNEIDHLKKELAKFTGSADDSASS
ncbi:MAG: UDP-3-O-(3-hydroxymyristoyl)glucosamine N-acyltransferase [Flavobacteriales bacterium]|nr:UDP-3-O-(3-hydroxymyristoyl)glucosamine N-acyltransferase [Flavobacteriales bacterium]